MGILIFLCVQKPVPLELWILPTRSHTDGHLRRTSALDVRPLGLIPIWLHVLVWETVCTIGAFFMEKTICDLATAWFGPWMRAAARGLPVTPTMPAQRDNFSRTPDCRKQERPTPEVRSTFYACWWYSILKPLILKTKPVFIWRSTDEYGQMGTNP